MQSRLVKQMSEGRIKTDADGRLIISQAPEEIPSENNRKIRMAVMGHTNTLQDNAINGRTSQSIKLDLIKRVKSFAANTANTKLGRSMGVVLKGVSKGVNVLDDLEIPLMLMDAFLVSKFPNESDFLSPGMVQDVKWQGVKTQIDFISQYNTDIIDPYNNNPANKPRERAQFPLIMGPLDKLDSTDELAQFIGAEYRSARAKVIVFSVAEQLLRTEGNRHRTELLTNPISVPNGDLQTYQTNIKEQFENKSINSLTSWFFDPRYFTAAQRDNLYRDAFTIACNNYGGAVYEDVHNADSTTWKGRPRFQCGFASQAACSAHSKDYRANKGLTGGDYAEWYSYTEINNLLGQITTSASLNACPVTSTNYSQACRVSSFNNNQTGLCMVTNSYMSTICDSFKGVYNENTHMCEYTMEYCQNNGMCYDKVNKVCQLPADTMFALNISLNLNGGAREWVKIHGCGFSADYFNPENIVTSAGQWMYDMLRDEHGISDGMKQSFGPDNPVGITALIGTVASAGAIAAGAGPVGGLIMVAMMVAIGVEIGVGFAYTNQSENQEPPNPEDYPKEYAITGLNAASTNALFRGYSSGWLTKPLKAHVLTNWPPLTTDTATTAKNKISYPADISGIPTSTRIDFFSRVSDLTAALNFYATTAEAIDSFTTIRHRTKNYCYDQNKMRSGSNAINNDTWCIDYKPPVQYADTNNIGQLASEAAQVLDGQTSTGETYITNRSWTNGKARAVPQYPGDGKQGAAWGNRPALWYYQLVYDKDKMVPDPATKMPKKLWDTDYLKLYFPEDTIKEMRVYYCNTLFKTDATGDSIDDRCWGYLNITVGNHKYSRMTIPGIN